MHATFLMLHLGGLAPVGALAAWLLFGAVVVPVLFFPFLVFAEWWRVHHFHSAVGFIWDRVTFPFGSGEAEGVIVEDRGCLGIGGRRLYGIRFELNPGDFRYVELPEVEMAPFSRSL